MNKKDSLIRMLTVQIVIVFLITSLLGGYLLIRSEYKEFQRESDRVREIILKNHQSLLKTQVKRAIEYVNIEHARIIRLAKDDILNKTTTLHDLLVATHTTLTQRMLPPAMVQNLLFRTIDNFNDNLDADILVNSMEGINIFHPRNPSKQGTSLLSLRDARKTRVVNEEINMVKITDEGFLSTYWKAKDTIRQRVTFVKYFAPLEWYITTSVYLDEFTEKVQKNMFQHLSNLRFGEDNEGYFFINSFKGDLIVSNGKVYDPVPNIWHVEDPNGIKVVQQNSRIAKENPRGGFSTYTWKKLDGTFAPKISFVQQLKDWDMYIGAGISLDTLEAMVSKEEMVLKKRISQRIYSLIVLFGTAAVLLLTLIFLLTKRLEKNTALFLDTFEKATQEYSKIPDEQIHFYEFRRLANGINIVLEALNLKQEEVRHQASHDYLTGLPNRLLTVDRLDLAIKNAKRANSKLALLFMDLDHFKRINDTMGHEAGDLLLQKIAKRLQAILRESDTIARISGDEFIFIFQNIHKDHILNELIERIFTLINEPFYIHHRTINIGGSLGVAVYPEDGTTVKELMKNADIAMYEAKHKGRNNFQFFNPAMDTKIHETILLEKEIAIGIQEDQFELYFQPQVAVQSNKVTGAEVLIRWNHPTKGLVFPNTFISVAEESNLIFDLGEWILLKACQQLALWHQAGHYLKIAVNISVKQLEHPSFLDVLTRILQKTNVPAHYVELEITESFSADNPTNIDTIFQLKKLGFTLAMDDFGTGYSSLSYLKKLPIDTLKIDRSFITDMLESADKLALVEVIIQTAKILKLHTVAEGVEQEEEVAILKNLECSEYQGYLFSKPVPLQTFMAFLQD